MAAWHRLPAAALWSAGILARSYIFCLTRRARLPTPSIMHRCAIFEEDPPTVGVCNGLRTETAGKDARGPDLVWRVPSLGAPSPSPAWDCGGLMWVASHLRLPRTGGRWELHGGAASLAGSGETVALVRASGSCRVGHLDKACNQCRTKVRSAEVFLVRKSEALLQLPAGRLTNDDRNDRRCPFIWLHFGGDFGGEWCTLIGRRCDPVPSARADGTERKADLLPL